MFDAARRSGFPDWLRSPAGIKKDRPRRFATLPRSHNAGSSPSLCQPALRFYTATRLHCCINCCILDDLWCSEYLLYESLLYASRTSTSKTWPIYGRYGHIPGTGARFSNAVRGVSRVICG